MNKIKMAKDIIKDIENRGQISVPDGYITGEAFEKWLYEDNEKLAIVYGDDYVCSDYNKETGTCKSSGKYCDTCYSYYINTPLD